LHLHEIGVSVSCELWIEALLPVSGQLGGLSALLGRLACAKPAGLEDKRSCKPTEATLENGTNASCVKRGMAQEVGAIAVGR